jgi:hypothetical protein
VIGYTTNITNNHGDKMIQVGDLVKHRHLGGLGLVKRVYITTPSASKAQIQWLINPYEGGGYTHLWIKLLKKSENK